MFLKISQNSWENTCAKSLLSIKLQASCSKLTIKTPERRHWCRSGVSIVNLEHEACNFNIKETLALMFSEEIAKFSRTAFLKNNSWRMLRNGVVLVSILLTSNMRSATLLKRDPGTGKFLWILQNFQEHPLYKTPLNNWFCLFNGDTTGTKLRRHMKCVQYNHLRACAHWLRS